MKNLWLSLFAIFFVIRDDGQPMTISGLSEKEIQGQGIYTIVNQKTYDDALAAMPDPVKPIDPIREKAIEDAKDTTKTPQERLDALIKAIDLR